VRSLTDLLDDVIATMRGVEDLPDDRVAVPSYRADAILLLEVQGWRTVAKAGGWVVMDPPDCRCGDDL
jgi:hypothetical protein